MSARCILVVDDEHEIVNVTKATLELEGHNILTAYSGNEAQKVFDKHPEIEIIISDVRMPDGDGVQFLDYVRSRKTGTPLFAFFTGFSEISEAEAIEKGAYKLFKKPIDLEKILDLVSLDELPAN